MEAKNDMMEGAGVPLRGMSPTAGEVWPPLPAEYSEGVFHTLMERVLDYGICLLDTGGNIATWNAGARRITGYEAKEIIGRHFSRLYLAEDLALDQPSKALEAAEAHGRTEEEGWRLRKDGGRFWANVVTTAVRNKFGSLAGFTQITRDITEQETARQRLEQNREELQNYIDSMSTFNAKVSTDGRILLANRAAQRAAGLPLEELLQSNFLEGGWFAYDPRVKARVTRAFAQAREGTIVSYDEQVFLGGTVVEISFSLVPVLDTAGKVAYIVAEGRDITSQKRAEEALRQRTVQLEHSNRELESFSYSVSHDLRAPLRSVDGFTLALLEEYRNRMDTVGLNYLQRVRTATGQMTQLIDALLKLAQYSRNSIRNDRVDLSAMAQEIFQELKTAQPGRTVETGVQAGLVAKGDPQLLRIVLSNVLGNAWKFTRKKAAAQIEFSGGTEGDRILLRVRDNGAGFDPAYAGRLFAPFQRLHEAAEFEGSGIGLATVQRIVSRHGGKIWAEAKPDEGATFYVSLPA